jgi:hypothetical protein
MPDDICSLLTVVEVGSALSTDPLTTSLEAGDPATCRYSLAANDLALKTVVQVAGAASRFKELVDQGLLEPVAGVGDAALYDSGDRRLYLMVGERLIILEAVYASDTYTTLKALTVLGKLVTARLTSGVIPPEAQLTARPVITADESCDLLTAEEAAPVVGKGPLTKSASEFTTDFCYFTTAGGEVALTTYFHAKLGTSEWPDLVGNMESDPVAGLGNEAAFEPGTGTLYVLSGDTILDVVVFGLEPDDALARDRTLMEIMLGHL